MILLTSCSPMGGGTKPAAAVPTDVQLPAATQSVEALVAILEVSDPASSTYDPASAAYAEFPEVLKQLAATNASSNDAASMLAYAMGFPRQDSVLAAEAIISLGPDWAATDLPSLVDYLTSQRAELRMVSAVVLSTIGDKASCSLGSVGLLLWDPDPFVRTAAALAIQGITGNELVANIYVITPDHLTPNPMPADTPEGKITGAARAWWDDKGSKVNWHPSYDLCDP